MINSVPAALPDLASFSKEAFADLMLGEWKTMRVSFTIVVFVHINFCTNASIQNFALNAGQFAECCKDEENNALDDNHKHEDERHASVT